MINNRSLCALLQKKYRQQPDSLRFTSVADSPDIVHAKKSYEQCSEVAIKTPEHGIEFLPMETIFYTIYDYCQTMIFILLSSDSISQARTTT